MRKRETYGPRDRTLRIEFGAGSEGVRRAAEAVLSALVKSYDLASETAEGGATAVVYRVRLKKRATAEAFIESFRAAAGSAVAKADLVD